MHAFGRDAPIEVDLEKGEMSPPERSASPTSVSEHFVISDAEDLETDVSLYVQSQDQGLDVFQSPGTETTYLPLRSLSPMRPSIGEELESGSPDPWNVSLPFQLLTHTA